MSSYQEGRTCIAANGQACLNGESETVCCLRNTSNGAITYQCLLDLLFNLRAFAALGSSCLTSRCCCCWGLHVESKRRRMVCSSLCMHGIMHMPCGLIPPHIDNSHVLRLHASMLCVGPLPAGITSQADIVHRHLLQNTILWHLIAVFVTIFIHSLGRGVLVRCIVITIVHVVQAACWRLFFR